MNYGFTKTVAGPIASVEARIKEELKKEGFGILTRIDVKEKFKEKLGIDFKDYIILGACNPPNALKAIEAEENIGLMLPCNIILYESSGNITVSVIKPGTAMSMIENSALSDLAAVIEGKLKSVFDNI